MILLQKGEPQKNTESSVTQQQARCSLEHAQSH